MVSECPDCRGKGKSKPKPDNLCSKCDGIGFKFVDKKLNVPIRKGISDDQKIIVENKGHQVEGKRGKLVLVVSTIPHPVFQRDDDNLICEINLTLAQAVCGFKKTIKFLDGKEIYLEYNEPIQHEEVKVIPKMGFNDGGLIIKFNVKRDESLNLSDEHRTVIKKMLSTSKNDKDELNREKSLGETYKKNKNKYHSGKMISVDDFRRFHRGGNNGHHPQDGPGECTPM
jgi:DnaJ-class molecular chaperone